MRSYTTAIILALPTLALSASLSDFKPYLTDLPTACEAVYKTQIPGCKDGDFKDGKGCSDSCVTGLNAMVPAVKLACGSAGISGNNVLSAMLAGNGVQQLCPNAPSAVVTTSAAPTTTSSPTTSSTPTSTSETPSSTSTSSSTSQQTSSATAATTSSSSSSSSNSSSSSTAQTTSAPAASSSSSTGRATSAGSSTSSAQAASRTGGNTSGGGSPFDTNTGAASGLSVSAQQLFAAAAVAAFALLR